MAAAAYFDQIQKIYIAFYQRPADPAGLRYWAGKVNDAGGDLGQVINAFAASTEANTLYGAIDASTIGGVIDSLYLALFNRPPEAAGRQFYIDSLAAGTFTPASIALAVLVGAQERDNDAIAHKLQVANEFTEQVDGRPLSDPAFGDSKGSNASYAGSAAEAAARAILSKVTSNPATVLTPAQVTSTLKADIAQPGDPILDGNTGSGGGDTGGGGSGGVPDTTPPAAAVLTSAAATNTATPVISGTAEVGATVTLAIGGATYEVLVPAGGAWSVDTASTPKTGAFALVDGSNVVTVTVKDPAGNTSAPAIQSLVYDIIPPAGAVLTSATATNSATPVISGEAEVGATVTVAVGGATYEVLVPAGGAWSVDTATATVKSGAFALVQGNNTVLVTVRDPAGNSSSAATSTLEYDSVAPTFISATTSTDGTKVILTYNEALSATTAAASAFDVQVAGVSRGVESVAAAGSTVVLTLASAVLKGEAVTVGYSDPSSGDDANAIQDTVGNDAANFTGAAVTNNAAPVFTVLDSGDNGYTIGNQNGNVTLTKNLVWYGPQDTGFSVYEFTFTPENGTVVTVVANGAKNFGDIDFIEVNGITLKATADAAGDLPIQGTGTSAVKLTDLQNALSVNLSAITTADLTVDFAAGSHNQKMLGSSANLGTAKITVSSGVLDVGSATMGTASFEVAGGAGLKGTGAKLSGVTAMGEGRVSVSGLDAATDLSGIATTSVNAVIGASIDLSTNLHLGTVTEYMVSQNYTVTLTAAQLAAAVVSGQGGVTVLGSDGAQTLNIHSTGTNTINAGGGADQIMLAKEGGADTVLVKLGVAQQEKSPSKVTFDMSFSPEIEYGELSIKIAGVNAGNPVIMEDLYVHNGGLNLATTIQGHLRAVDGHRTDISVLWSDPFQITVTDALGRAFSDVSLAGYDDLMEGFVNIGSNVQITVSTTATSEVLSDSYLGAFDTITNFQIGADKIDLLTSTGASVNTPTALVRVDDVASSDDLAAALTSAFAALTPNQAGLVMITGGTAAGTYLYADNGNGTVDAGADVFIQLVGMTGTLGAVGDLTVSHFFA